MDMVTTEQTEAIIRNMEGAIERKSNGVIKAISGWYNELIHRSEIHSLEHTYGKTRQEAVLGCVNRYNSQVEHYFECTHCWRLVPQKLSINRKTHAVLSMGPKQYRYLHGEGSNSLDEKMEQRRPSADMR